MGWLTESRPVARCSLLCCLLSAGENPKPSPSRYESAAGQIQHQSASKTADLSRTAGFLRTSQRSSKKEMLATAEQMWTRNWVENYVVIYEQNYIELDIDVGVAVAGESGRALNRVACKITNRWWGGLTTTFRAVQRMQLHMFGKASSMHARSTGLGEHKIKVAESIPLSLGRSFYQLAARQITPVEE
ncbi:hypothetical protein LSTR_LSTR001936 [Laodelphax striatellus]|uniref:Uncharacterized protein n=1 Tax=Laodelphax striatellus TaxID=195883 RepID=A0A482XG31_LAOST|nr:hypothetical protein LSTR_LSTR001936 [Laodelphax striatellus]